MKKCCVCKVNDVEENKDVCKKCLKKVLGKKFTGDEDIDINGYIHVPPNN